MESDPDPLVRGPDPDPRIRTKMSRIPNAARIQIRLLNKANKPKSLL
jgi:hypothetical protein